MIENMKLSERLYLSKKGGQEIYIDICNLPQHQIDAIRFLYKQFKKKNQGVILNDPPGCGEFVQVVLFLHAIRTSLSQSILILCKEAKATNWVQHFQKWTSFEEHAILIESFNPNRNKMLICVNPMKNIAQFAKRTWSVVIVDDDGENTKEILKTKFKTNFKILITTQDIKENVKMFSQILNWLKPDENFNMNDFIPNGNDARDIVTKAILLDAFMQDVVLRRSNLVTPVKVEKTSHTIQPKLSRKNKDITGKKIKRSKKTIVTDEINTDDPHDDNSKTAELVLKPLRDVEETALLGMDVETFITQEKPIVLETLEELDYMKNSENNKHDETSRIESDTSIDNDISNTRTEFDSSDNSSICTKDDELNKSDTNVLKVIDNEEIEITIDDVFKSEADDKINFTDIKNKDTVDVNKSAVLMEIESPNKSHKTLGAIVQEMEEKSLKKFKGSFLDSIL